VDYGLDLTLEDAERFKAIFDRTYAHLRWWQMEQQRQAEQTGRLRTAGGRVIAFRDPTHVYTDSRNYPVQAGAADLQLLAIQRVHAALKETALPAHLVNFVHDELVLEARLDAVEDAATLLQARMTGAFLDLFKGYPGAESIASGLVEVGKGPSYAEAK
jgi:DNA polymerase-1